MSIVQQAEDAIVAIVKATLGNHVRQVATVPANLSAVELADRFRAAPAVYVGFLGGPPKPSDTAVILDAKFAVYALTDNSAGEAARRRGDASAIGAYDIIEAVTPALHGAKLVAGAPPAPLDGTGTLTFDEVVNLWAEDLDKAGVSLYAAMFRVPLTFAPPAGAGNLGNFAIFDAQYDIEPFKAHASPLPAPAGTVDAEDKVVLPT